MILEDECMVLMGTAFWHLTYCIVQGTSELVAALLERRKSKGRETVS